jgi:hypothetical protein
MNIGIYLDCLRRIDEIDGIDNLINNNLKNQKISDASIFYNDVGFVEKKVNCGKFNSSDLWNFSGTLIVPYLSCLFKIDNIVNNIKVIYYYGLEEKTPVFNTIKALSLCDDVICRNNESAKYLYRITGKNIVNIVDNFENIIESIK